MSSTEQDRAAAEHNATDEQTAAAELDRRYGRTPGNARLRRWLIAATAAAFAVVLVLWVVWGGLLGANADIEAVDTGHSIVDDTLVQVRYQLTVEPGSTVSCAFQAQNSSFGIVGWKIVEVPASEQRTRTLGTDVRTTELSVTGLIYRCWLT